jgi:hypothetical protein
MQTLIKRFTVRIDRLQLVLVSLAAGLISVRLSFLSPYLQFAATAVIMTALISPTMFFKDRSRMEKCLILTQILASLILSLGSIYRFAAVFGVLSVVIAPFSLKKIQIALAAFASHLMEAFFTLLALSGLKEANPVMAFAINQVGAGYALIVSKFLLIGLPLIYGYRELDDDDFRLFTMMVLVLGLSLAARNIFLYFSQ